APPAVSSTRCGSPVGAAHNTVEHGTARLWLVLDRRHCMVEDGAAGMAPGGRGTGSCARVKGAGVSKGVSSWYARATRCGAIVAVAPCEDGELSVEIPHSGR